MEPVPQNSLIHSDCIPFMQTLPDGCIDLVIADPPFNNGYHYDVYDDDLHPAIYIRWCHDWMREVARILKPNGTFWLATNDANVANQKVLVDLHLGLTLRRWCIWHYTFGQNCARNFTPSHAHLLYFVKDPKHCTFNADDPDLRIKSARQLARDKRANPKGRLPDDVWTLPRLAGTHAERENFPCQMALAILRRMIRATSNPGDIVYDPFVGSGTTAVATKQLGRTYLGTDVSENYIKNALKRLDETYAL